MVSKVLHPPAMRILLTLGWFGFLTVTGLFARTAAFELDQELIWIEVQSKDHATPLSFILDTGAEETVIDVRAAGQLGLRLESKELVQGVGGTAQAYRTAPSQLHCAGVTLTKSFLAIDLSAAAQHCERRVDGLLGADYFRDRVVRIDYATRTLSIVRQAVTGRRTQSLPIIQNYGAMCVPLQVGEDRLGMVRIDTGLGDFLHWSPPGAESRSLHRRGNSIGLSGNYGFSTLQTVQIGARSLENVRTIAHETQIFQGEDGLLGNALLQQFVVTIDMRQGVLILEDR